MTLVTVMTPTIPGREEMLRECMASVWAQDTDARLEHIVLLDKDSEGCSVTMNKIAAKAQGEWLLPLADDDLLFPGCVETLLDHSTDADVVYSPPILKGMDENDGWWFFQEPPYIPSCALIHARLWRDLGGYDETAVREEDRKLWTLALDTGARFVRVDEPTWVYRLGYGGNKSMAGVPA